MEGCHGVPVTPQCWCGAYWNTDCNRHSPGAGQVGKEGIVDIAGTIRKMRRQRMKMVQTPVRAPPIATPLHQATPTSSVTVNCLKEIV